MTFSYFNKTMLNMIEFLFDIFILESLKDGYLREIKILLPVKKQGNCKLN